MSQVVTQMRRAVSYKYGIFFCFSRIYFPTKTTHVTMSFTLPKGFRENAEGFQMSWLIMCGCVACVQNNNIKGRVPFLQLFLKLLPLEKYAKILSYKWHRLCMLIWPLENASKKVCHWSTGVAAHCTMFYYSILLNAVHSYDINTLRPRQNGRHFANDTFKRIFVDENFRILMKFHWSLFLRVQFWLRIFHHWFR